MGAPPKIDVHIITPNNLADADRGSMENRIFSWKTRWNLLQYWVSLCSLYLRSNKLLVHHGLIYVPIGYTFEAGIFKMVQVKGGSPYGAGIFVGDGPRQPTEIELG
ncbi:hypothetical protein MKW92_050759 [Papaver armeniacum]|nr:hypothetical protein MKW92_050759 [Papaver armeniacum]